MYTQKEIEGTESDRAWLCVALFVIGLVLVIVLDGCCGDCQRRECPTGNCFSSDATPQTRSCPALVIEGADAPEKPEAELEPPGECVSLPDPARGARR